MAKKTIPLIKLAGDVAEWSVSNKRTLIIVGITVLVHVLLILYVSFDAAQAQTREDATIFKMVDVKEYIPPKEIKKPEPEVKKDAIEVNKQDAVAEDVVATDKEIKELDIDYLPQSKLSELPGINYDLIKSRIVYPPLADKQGLSGKVILLLYIDSAGNLKKVEVLKDFNPGFGFAEAAVKALTGLRFTPAKVNGVPVAVMYKYPIVFTPR